MSAVVNQGQAPKLGIVARVAAAAAAIGFVVVNFVIGNFFEPRMMGVALGLSTLVVFVSMLFWGWLWGPLGALFAVPLTMLLRSALAVSDETLRFPNADPEWNQAAMALAQMQPNQYLNPQRTPAGWRIAQLLEKQQAPTPYARVPESVRQSIAQHLLDTAREKAFAVYADSLQKALKPRRGMLRPLPFISVRQQ